MGRNKQGVSGCMFQNINCGLGLLFNYYSSCVTVCTLLHL